MQLSEAELQAQTEQVRTERNELGNIRNFLQGRNYTMAFGTKTRNQQTAEKVAERVAADTNPRSRMTRRRKADKASNRN